MLIIDSFGHNIFLDKELVGYIGENELFIRGQKFASITDDGIMSILSREIGYIDDDGSIIINGKEVGYIDGDNNFVFFKLPIKNS
ncbi:MAG TPA: hypothetical protein PKV57_00620 [Bacilli bacterium]|nr:hypothetical protein [Bacilli bacterium]